MNAQALKARSSWLFSFGDVVTLLITFFIMMIVLNKGEISRVQKWTEQQLDQTYQALQQQVVASKLVAITRKPSGIVIEINHDDAFLKGGFDPSEQLTRELETLGQTMESLPLFKMTALQMPPEIMAYAQEGHLKWRAEVSVSGFTDNDKIDARSAMRNNWFLSTMRAQSVMRVLYEASGLAPDQFGVAGYGEYRPIASNQTEEGKAKNRRVTILISATFEKNGLTDAKAVL